MQLARKRIGVRTVLMTIVLGVTSIAMAREPDWSRPVEQQPYQIVFDLLCVTDGEKSAGNEIAAELLEVFDRIAGPAFVCRSGDVEHRPPVSLGGPSTAETIDASSMAAPDDADRWLRVVTSQVGTEWQLSLRQWSRETQSFGVLARTTVADRSRVATALFGLFVERFAVTAVIDRIDEAAGIHLRLQAGRLACFDDELTTLKPGAILQPGLQFYSRDNERVKAQDLPWTYLVVTSADGATARCRYVSGLRNPFGSGTRGRIELAAAAVDLPLAMSVVSIEHSASPPRPAAWTKVEVVPDVPAVEDPPQAVERLTDRRGRLTLLLDPEHPLQWLTVKSGATRLARVPFLPGSVGEITLTVPDDAARLRVERELVVLESRLIESVVRRSAAIATAIKAAWEGRWNDACRERRLIDEIPGARLFSAELSAIRVAGVKLAGATGSVLTKRRIEADCRRVQKTIDKFLENTQVKELDEQMTELKRIEAETGGGEFRPPCTGDVDATTGS